MTKGLERNERILRLNPCGLKRSQLHPPAALVRRTIYRFGRQLSLFQNQIILAGPGEGSDENLRLSSVVMVGRAEKLTAGENNSTNPLQVGEVQVFWLDFAVAINSRWAFRFAAGMVTAC